MEQIIISIITSLSPAALPLVVVIVAGLYFFYKFKSLEQDRIITKQQRDTDSHEVHDDILKLKFDVTNLQGIVNLHRDRLESIDKQLSLVNQELVKLNIQVEHLATALEKQNDIMMNQIKME